MASRFGENRVTATAPLMKVLGRQGLVQTRGRGGPFIGEHRGLSGRAAGCGTWARHMDAAEAHRQAHTLAVDRQRGWQRGRATTGQRCKGCWPGSSPCRCTGVREDVVATLCSGGHVAEGAHQVATVQVAHAHATGWLSARKAHTRQAVGNRDSLGRFVGSGWPRASWC
jgi:hypothetical protein